MTDSTFPPVNISIGLEDLDNCPNPVWTVEKILVSSGLGILSGNGGHGKSWLLLNLALSVASGRKWLDTFTVRRGPVVIIDEENSLPLLKQRKNLLMAGLGLTYSDLMPIRIVSHRGIDFYPRELADGSTEYKIMLKCLMHELQVWQPSLIIVDSLRAAHSGEENDSGDIRNVMNTIRYAASQAGNNAAVMVAHHVNKSGSFRGSIDILQAANCLIEVDKNNSIINLTCSKLRDDIEFKPFQVELVSSPSSVRLEYRGEKPPKPNKEDRETWLKNILIDRGNMSREKLVELAKADDVCGSRTLDDLLKDCEAQKIIIGYKVGKDKHYKVNMPEDDLEFERQIREMAQTTMEFVSQNGTH